MKNVTLIYDELEEALSKYYDDELKPKEVSDLEIKYTEKIIKGSYLQKEEISDDGQRLERITSFLKDESQVLDIDSPQFLIENEEVALASIRRDVNSIDFVGILTTRVKEFAIEQALKKRLYFKCK